MPVGTFNVLEVEPLNLHSTLVVVRAQIEALDPCDVDLVQDGVIHLDHKIFFAIVNTDLDSRFKGKGLVVHGRHHVLRLNAQAAIGKAV